MGTESCTVALTLTDEEKAKFLNLADFDSNNYCWEFDENELTITYTEEPESAPMDNVYDSAYVDGKKFAILIDSESMKAYEAVEINGEWVTDFSYPTINVNSFDVAEALNFDGAKKAGYHFED